jgi:hypothetical protein
MLTSVGEHVQAGSPSARVCSWWGGQNRHAQFIRPAGPGLPSRPQGASALVRAVEHVRVSRLTRQSQQASKPAGVRASRLSTSQVSRLRLSLSAGLTPACARPWSAGQLSIYIHHLACEVQCIHDSTMYIDMVHCFASTVCDGFSKPAPADAVACSCFTQPREPRCWSGSGKRKNK